MHLYQDEDIDSIYTTSTLDELGLENNGVFHVIPEENIGEISNNEREKFDKLINEFSEIFATSDLDLGKAKGVTHKVDTADFEPIFQHAYRRSPAANKIIQEEVNKLLKGELIKPSNSPWASPLLLVKKKDGSNRVVIDYRKLNSISKKDRYPLPRIDDTLDKMHGAQYFSAMDLISGYWQIPMDEENQQKCAFITSEGLYQPIRMPQGLANAPATFQRLMDNNFRTLKNTCVLVYLDNINVYLKSFDSHLKDLCKVFYKTQRSRFKAETKEMFLF